MEQVIEVKTTDSFGNQTIGSKTIWIEQPQINADGKAYSGHKGIEAVIRTFNQFDEYILQTASPAARKWIQIGLIAMVGLLIGVGVGKTVVQYQANHYEHTTN